MAERIEGLSIGLDLDTLALDRGLTGLKDKLKTVNSEMKANMSAFERGDKSIERYETSLMGLNKKLDVQKRVVSEAKSEYEKMVKEFGEGSKEAEKAAREYNNQVSSLNSLQRYINKTENELKELREEQQKSESGWNKFGQTIENTGTKLTGIGQGLTVGLTTPLLGAGLAIGKTALDFDKASGQIQADLGISEEKAKELNEVAKELWEDGFGDSIEGVSSKIAGVTRSLGDLSKVDLSYVTKGLDLFEQRGWADQQESLRAIKVLMEQFGMSAQEAMDYLTKGFQENLDFSGEFLDSVSEYATYFAEFGLTADDMFAKFKAGAESGAFQLDKVGDAMKEFSLRAKDGSKTSEDAFKALGLNASEMTKQFNKGGKDAKKAFETVVKALKDTDDETKRNTASVGLFGTQYEDLGEKAFEAMLEASNGLKDVEGATKRASDALQNNFGTRVTKIWREFVADLKPAGDILLDFAEGILPKVADTVDDVTNAFAELSPEAQKTALSVGGIAAAAGPTLMVIGGISRGFGVITKVVGPLLGTLGEGKGLTGILKRIPGPIGAITTGLGIGTIAFQGINAVIEKSKEVNLEHVNSLIKQQQSLETLSTKYGELQSKNKLSNDELLRFRDIQSELQLAKSASEISALKDEQAELQEKSGLTNNELSEMLRLNDEIVKLTPTVAQSYSERGNAIISSKDAISEVNKELQKSIALELENQKIKAEAQLDKNIQNYIKAQEELNNKIRERTAAEKEAADIEKEIQDLKSVAQQQYNDGQKAAAQMTQDEITRQEFLLNQKNQQVVKIAEEVTEKQKSLEKTGEEITKTQQLLGEMINLQLAQVGINEKGAEGIAQLDQAISKAASRHKYLTMLSETQGGLNDKQKEELKNLDQSLSKYNSAKTAIQGMQNEQEEVNQKIREGTGEASKLTKEADKDVTKNVKVDDKGGAKKVSNEANKKATKNVKVTDHGGAKKVSAEASKNAKKNVNVDDKGKAKSIHETASKNAKKTITFGAIATAGFKGAIKAVEKATGINIPGFATGTKNAPGGLSLVGEEGPELVHLPRGAKVIPNKDTESIFQKWNVPMMSISREGFATGGLINTAGLYPIAEGGWPEIVVPTDPSRRTDAMKLLAIAGKKLTGNKRPNQLPNVAQSDDSYLGKKVEELTNLVKDLISIQQEQLVALAAGHIIQMNDRTVGILVEPHITEIQKRNGKVESKFKRR
ncbi:phage tail tape measure protein [Metabacillus niabensis]|uniref:Phage-related minor tail protein/SLT domain-containing protein n=1 Tax=Metabacillus niabensis TaxID=324854 RepID=A0ABT9Z8Z6_9BACI|nr:phage tail tape measure protein [Metabacillus niabensis]MDQ0228409.1 phage-related minor tail protein/SLT domain-containing protein [Metabacillus niabensis]